MRLTTVIAFHIKGRAQFDRATYYNRVNTGGIRVLSDSNIYLSDL